MSDVPAQTYPAYERHVLRSRWREVVAETTAKHGCGIRDILGRHGPLYVSRARFEVMWRLLHELGLNSCEIGRKLDRDPSTVRYGIARHEGAPTYVAARLASKRSAR